jgi:hypothetical protein
MSETRWALLRLRLESLRDLVAWVAVAALAVGVVGSYAAVQDLRRAVEGQSAHLEWYRYVNAAVAGAGIPLLVVSILVSLAVLLTAGSRVTSAFGEAAFDADDDVDGDDDE